MYERRASNVRKSIALIGLFIGLVVAVGWAFGYLTGFGYGVLVVAVIVAILSAWASYFWSDRIALGMSRAKPADPAAYKQLHNVVEGLCIAAGLPKPGIYVIDDAAPNAFATGRDPNHAAVAVTTGLLQKMNRDELEGVIAHELAHIRNRDILLMTLAVTLVGIVILLADWMFRVMWWSGMSGGRGGRRDREGAALPVMLVALALMILAPIIAQLLQFAISRRREFLADTEAVLITRHPDGLVRALEKLRTDQTVVRTASRATAHLWIEAPIARSANEVDHAGGGSTAWINRLFNTHPPLEERIAALRASALGNAPTSVTAMPR